MFVDQPQRLAPLAGLTADFQVRLACDEQGIAVPHDRVVVGDDECGETPRPLAEGTGEEMLETPKAAPPL